MRQIVASRVFTSTLRPGLSAIRILVADDDKDWQSQIRSLLQARPEWQMVCEVLDGSEAVEKAEKLKPDIVLLESSLPNLNGIDAARRIRQLSPNSKILFLSMDNSSHVIQVALSTGAQGYVYKARAQSDLLPAIDAVLAGKEFVTRMLRGYRFTDTTGARPRQRHEVQFYSDDVVLLDRLVPFVAASLESGDVAIVVATESHRDLLAQRLKAEGLDVDAAIKEERYIPVDALETLSAFMVSGIPDSDRFLEVVGDLIEEAAKRGKKEHPRVAVFGEWTSLLLADRKVDAAIRLEQLGNQLVTTYETNILCAYALSLFHGAEDQNVLHRICAEHSAAYLDGNN